MNPAIYSVEVDGEKFTVRVSETGNVEDIETKKSRPQQSLKELVTVAVKALAGNI